MKMNDIFNNSINSDLEKELSSRVTNPWNADTPMSYSAMWLGAKECVTHINNKITGEDIHWLNYIMKKYMAPAFNGKGKKKKKDYKCLLLGSNEGWMERTLCEAGFEGGITASDIANKALKRAEEKLKALGYKNVKYVVADLNLYKFKEKYDFIIAEGVLHHIQNIEECLQMLKSILSDDGLLFMMEFEGPFRFQLSDKQVRWINAALNVLPKVLRPFPNVHFPNALNEGANYPATLCENSKVFYIHPFEEEIVKFDPSEAICGHKLKQLIHRNFKVIQRSGIGGTILSYITGHFDFQRTNTDKFANEWLKILISIEDTCINTGILDDDFVFYVLSH